MTRIAHSSKSGEFSAFAATTAAPGECTSRVGSPFYRAPEQVFCFPPYPTTYGPGVDVWSAGVVTYVILAGNYPFYDEQIPPPPIESSGRAPPLMVPSRTAAGGFASGCGSPPGSGAGTSGGGGFGGGGGGGGSVEYNPAARSRLLQTFHSFPAHQWANVSEAAKSAINEMLIVDPQLRPSAAAMLEHRWFQQDAAPFADEDKAAFGVGGAAAAAASASGSTGGFSGTPLSHDYARSMRALVNAAKRAREIEASSRSMTSLVGSVERAHLGDSKKRRSGVTWRPPARV